MKVQEDIQKNLYEKFMDKRKIRDGLRLTGAVLCCWMYIPHLVIYGCKKNVNKTIKADLSRRLDISSLRMPIGWMFLYYIHNDRYFRNLFYHRVGPATSLLIGWWRPGDRYFVLSQTMKIGEGAYFAHPFASEFNAKSIGKNFSCRHLTTLGNKQDGDNDNRPVIGDNVTLGVNVTIIGGVTIGNNVTIGAGSVVVKDIPDNSIAVGNPARVIRTL